MIRERGDQLSLEVRDFLPGSTQRVRTRLHYASPTRLRSDIPGVEIRFALEAEPVPALTLIWGEEMVEVRRLPADKGLPLELLQQGRIEECVANLLEEKEFYLREVSALEAILNRAGYQQLRENRFQEAIALLRLNVELFPESSNTFDSLGEAYLANGDTELSLRNYRRSLELNPANENAAKVLDKLVN